MNGIVVCKTGKLTSPQENYQKEMCLAQRSQTIECNAITAATKGDLQSFESAEFTLLKLNLKG